MFKTKNNFVIPNTSKSALSMLLKSTMWLVLQKLLPPITVVNPALALAQVYPYYTGYFCFKVPKTVKNTATK